MRRGVWQLKQLEISFCKHGGSSRGVRALISDGGPLEEFRESNPQIDVKITQKANRHPVLRAHYLWGRIVKGEQVPKVIPVPNLQPSEIMDYIVQLRNQWGSKAKSWNERHWRENESVQGTWTPLSKID